MAFFFKCKWLLLDFYRIHDQFALILSNCAQPLLLCLLLLFLPSSLLLYSLGSPRNFFDFTLRFVFLLYHFIYNCSMHSTFLLFILE